MHFVETFAAFLCASQPVRFAAFLCASFAVDADGSRQLIGDKDGQLYMLMLSHVNGQVRRRCAALPSGPRVSPPRRRRLPGSDGRRRAGPSLKCCN